jgi:glycosyltransferase involved in cell wall biosynthesis
VRIGIDATWARYTGSGTASYTAGLVRALAARERHELVLYFAAGDAGTNPLWDLNGPHITRCVTAHRPQPIRSMATLALSAARDQLDIFHSPGYFLPLWPGPKVVSFHDANMFLQFRRRWLPGGRLDSVSLGVQAAISSRLARQIVTLTRSAASDIQQVFRLPTSRISVVYPGIDECFFDIPTAGRETSDRFGLDRYILSVGEITPQKNLEGLIRAFAMLDARDTTLAVAGTGNGSYRQNRLEPLVHGLGLAGRVRFLGMVPQVALPGLYAGAAAFAMPSFSEGFGLPVIEAMAAGVPVAASNRSSIPEIAAGAALLVDPDDPRQLASALGRLLTDQPLRQSLIPRGRENAERFRWDRAAEAMTAVYENAVEPRDG